MGIHGLLPFLKKASRQANIKEFKGCTVAIDSYCWLHRGAFACAEKLALGEKTDQYVYYCMKYLNNLLSFGIKPIMVFDGCRLPLKQDVEKARRERRAVNRKKAAQLLMEGKRSEARDCLAQCVDVTPDMALELINACREKNIDCIVAPYEADAQLAYLNRCGIAQVIITEDSDLVLFGCDRIMFKMDIGGNGVMLEQQHLNKAIGLHADVYTFDKFRYACILSGCDYLSSLPGIGLVKATKVFQLSRQSDVAMVIKKMPSLLKMPALNVTIDYVDAFFRANNCFLYQLVFDPLQRKLVPLNPYPDDVDPVELHYAGPHISDAQALQIALGNINVNTGERMADFNPDRDKPKSGSWNDVDLPPHMRSIWSRSYRPHPTPFRSSHDLQPVERPSTKGKEVVMKVSGLKVKRARPDDESFVPAESLVNLYGTTPEASVYEVRGASVDDVDGTSTVSKRPCLTDCDLNCSFTEDYNDLLDHITDDSMQTRSSPRRIRNVELSPSTLSADKSSARRSPKKLLNKENSLMASLAETPRKCSPVKCKLSSHTAPRQRNIVVQSDAGPADAKGVASSPSNEFISPATHRKNVFAMNSSRPRFNVNATKQQLSSPEPPVEVLSRFFVPKHARQETDFFKELKKQDTVENEDMMQTEDGNSDVENSSDNDNDDYVDGVRHAEDGDDKDDDVNKVEAEFTNLNSVVDKPKIISRDREHDMFSPRPGKLLAMSLFRRHSLDGAARETTARASHSDAVCRPFKPVASSCDLSELHPHQSDRAVIANNQVACATKQSMKSLSNVDYDDDENPLFTTCESTVEPHERINSDIVGCSSRMSDTKLGAAARISMKLFEYRPTSTTANSANDAGKTQQCCLGPAAKMSLKLSANSSQLGRRQSGMNDGLKTGASSHSADTGLGIGNCTSQPPDSVSNLE